MKLLTNTGMTRIKKDFPPKKKYCTGVIMISSSSAPAVHKPSLVGLKLVSFTDGNGGRVIMTINVAPKESYNKLLSMSVFFCSGQVPAAENTVFNVSSNPGIIKLMYGRYDSAYSAGGANYFSKSILTSPLYVHVLLVYN